MMKVNQDMYARIFKDLLDGPLTAHDAVELSGMHIVTAQELMRCLKKHKVVHVCAWEKDKLGRDATPVYQLGEGRDKKRACKTPAEKAKQYRARKKQMSVMGVKA